MPVRYGIRRTKISMLIYIFEFILAAALLSVFGYAGAAYLAIATILGAVWLVALRARVFGARRAANKAWARQMFFLSLIVMVALFATIAAVAIA